jgi:glycosyltransferase involved in cell wall biosynthesis
VGRGGLVVARRRAGEPFVKVALVHDWLTGMRGGEKVLERVAAMFPEAPIHALVWKRGSVSAAIESHPIRTSWLQRLPDAERRYRWFLPLYPSAIESFDLSAYDVVISTSHAAAKSARSRPGAFHLSYVFTPMRYVWELESEYFPPGRFPWPLSAYVRSTCARLRRWDTATASRPTRLLADSRHVADRIRRNWGREADVIYPPIDMARLTPGLAPREGYLLAGAFAPYKRPDLAVEACRRLGRRLTVAGSGPDQARLQALAGPDVRFTGWVSDEQLAELFRGARALLFPGEEDFGIVPVEAMACGCPVIAFGMGGAVETVGRGLDAAALRRLAAGSVERAPGGILFGDPSVEGLMAAITRFEAESFDAETLHAFVAPFDAPRFDREFRAAFEAGLAATAQSGAA